MNILLLCDEYPPCRHGGIGTVTRILAREFVKKGHMVVVCGLYPYYRPAAVAENDFGVKVNRFFYGNKIKLKLSRHQYLSKIINVKNEFYNYINFIRNIIKEQNIEIIEMPDYHEIFRYSGTEFIQFPDFGIPKIVKIHGGNTFFNFIREKSVVKDILYSKEQKLLSDATVVLAISEFSKSLIKSVFDYKKEIPVIYNGIEINTSFKYSGNAGNSIVVFAGTITEKKGVFSLVKSWEKVISEVPGAALFIFGKGSSKSLEKLNGFITETTKNSIHLMGFTNIDILKKVYAMASCAIFPSYAESFGMAPLEAMEVECPTIFTRRASGPELIEDGVEGLLVDPDNIAEISNAIIFLLKNRIKAVELGQRGSEKVRSHFDISKIADQHLLLYKEITLNGRI